MTETATPAKSGRTVRIKRTPRPEKVDGRTTRDKRQPWSEDRPRPEKVDGRIMEPYKHKGPKGNGANKLLKARLIRPGINSYSLYNQRELVIAELLRQPSIPRAARKLGMSPKTIMRWLQTEEFNAQYRAAREQVLELTISTIGSHVTEAIATLGRNLNCGRPDSEIRAAAVILNWAGKFLPGTDMKAAADKLAGAMQQGNGGATIIVVDGTEDEYVEGLKEVTGP